MVNKGSKDADFSQFILKEKTKKLLPVYFSQALMMSSKIAWPPPTHDITLKTLRARVRYIHTLKSA